MKCEEEGKKKQNTPVPSKTNKGFKVAIREEGNLGGKGVYGLREAKPRLWSCCGMGNPASGGETTMEEGEILTCLSWVVETLIPGIGRFPAVGAGQLSPRCSRVAVGKHPPPPCLSWQIKAVIKIQAFVRANKARGDYRMLGKCLLVSAPKWL